MSKFVEVITVNQVSKVRAPVKNFDLFSVFMVEPEGKMCEECLRAGNTTFPSKFTRSNKRKENML